MLSSVSEATLSAVRPRARRTLPILIVDDDRAVREILREGLTEYGLPCVTVTSAGDALEAVDERPLLPPGRVHHEEEQDDQTQRDANPLPSQFV